MTSAPLIDGIYSAGKTGLVVENCEIYNWPYVGIACYSDRLPGLGSSSKAHIHHNYVHHCRRQGLGYGVQIGASSALIEANIFDYCRHAIAGERGYPVFNYDARFNVVEPHITNSMFDMHVGNDDPSWGFDDGPDPRVPAGGTILIHHNTFKSSTQIAVGIRGVPTNVCTVYNNWTYWSSGQPAKSILNSINRLYASIIYRPASSLAKAKPILIGHLRKDVIKLLFVLLFFCDSLSPPHPCHPCKSVSQKGG